MPEDPLPQPPPLASTVPPVIRVAAEQPLNSRPAVARWRWWIHLILLTASVAVPAIIGLLVHPLVKQAALPAQTGQLLLFTSLELGQFALIFGLAWLCSRASPEELFLRWRGG